LLAAGGGGIQAIFILSDQQPAKAGILPAASESGEAVRKLEKAESGGSIVEAG
jgi:hypothetical protein